MRSICAKVQWCAGDTPQLGCPPDGDLLKGSPEVASRSYPTLDTAMLASKLRDTESGNLLQAAIAMVGAKNTTLAGGVLTPPPPSGHAFKAMPDVMPLPPPGKTSFAAMHSENADLNACIHGAHANVQQGCGVCKLKGVSGERRGVRQLPVDICNGSALLCKECFAKAVAEGRSVLLQGGSFRYVLFLPFLPKSCLYYTICMLHAAQCGVVHCVVPLSDSREQ